MKKTNKEEFWLKPLGKPSIEPNETISFSDFQITWTPTESYAGSIMGFTYSDQMKDGIAVINPINLNGSVLNRRMRMSDTRWKEQELFVKHMIRQIMKDQLNELKEDKQENNNSYVFLENSTLNMLILYMLMKEER